MSDNVVEGTVVDDDYEIIKMSRIVEIAKGNITENISDMEMEFAKVLMIGYQMCAEDFTKQLETKIDESIMNMKNNAVTDNEIDVEVDMGET